MIRDHWYVACLSGQLRKRPLARTVLDVPIALFRDGRGAPVAVLDRCPHRNVPLSMGTVTGDGLLQCAYHGWRFDSGGVCRAVPGLEGDPDRRARRVDAFPTAEHDGLVWVFPVAGAAPAGGPYRLPHVDQPGYRTVRRADRVAAGLHAALENTLDVPHTAFLHGGLFRGGRPPVEIGVVVRHSPGRIEAEYVGEPRPPGMAGRILAPGGGVVEHVDRFLLPSIAQVEYRLENNHLLATSAFTPVTADETMLHAVVTFRVRLPGRLVEALVMPVANRIFAQDKVILAAQAGAVRRFGGEQFASTELDVLGQHIGRMLRRAERGEADEDLPDERRFTMRV